MRPDAPGAGRIRVGIVDDHAITRRALREFLSERGRVEVVGQASSGRGAIELARTVPMDVLILDIDMPGQSGIDALPHIIAREGAPRVLILSGHPPAAYGVAMVRRGAAGYLNKQCDPEEIVQAIEVVARGQRYLNGEMTALLIEGAVSDPPDAPHLKLTRREFQIFLRMAQGQTNEEAARDLSLSPKSVATYRVRVMAKVRARTNSELTYYAIKHKLIA